MSRHKPNRGQNHPPTSEKKTECNEKSANRHVYIEPGVQIDLVQDLKQKYETAQSDNAAHSKKILFWTKISAALLFIYAGLTLLMYFANKKSADAAKNAADTANTALHVGERAYISEGFPVLDVGKKTVTWDLINTGHIPSKNADLLTQAIVIDHRTIVANSPLASLARLGLARAHVLASDNSKARAAYQDFFALWKDADLIRRLNYISPLQNDAGSAVTPSAVPKDRHPVRFKCESILGKLLLSFRLYRCQLVDIELLFAMCTG